MVCVERVVPDEISRIFWGEGLKRLKLTFIQVDENGRFCWMEQEDQCLYEEIVI